MSKTSAYNFDTLSLHAGQQPDPQYGARAAPIYLTTSFVFKDADQAAALFNMERAGHVYSRISNPTNAVLEERIAALEGGVGAIAAASGQAALHLAICTLMGAGGHIVASRSLYGGSHNLLEYTLPRFGIETTFVNPRDLDAWRAAIRPETRLLFGETLGNPGLDVLDVPRVAEIAHAAGLPLMVDSTFTTPYLMRPFDLGADLLFHSATKFLGGHGVAIGGLLVDSGKFDWERHAKRFPLLNEPDPSYHGAVWTQAVKPLGPIAYIIRARVVLLRDLGAAMSPFNAFLFLQGLETLPLRMREHCRNAQAVASYLRGHPQVTKVIFPGFTDGEQQRRAAAYLKGGFGGLVGFELKGGKEAGRRFIDALKLFYHVANIGDARSLAIHPATTTHSQLAPEEQLKTGVSDGFVRLSVGLEHIDDILGDLDQALAAAAPAKAA